MFRVCLCSLLLLALFGGSAAALECPDIDFIIYQFPRDMIPRIDGDPSDWAMVPEEYVYGTELLHDTDSSHEVLCHPADLDIKVTVGWGKGLNRWNAPGRSPISTWTVDG